MVSTHLSSVSPTTAANDMSVDIRVQNELIQSTFDEAIAQADDPNTVDLPTYVPYVKATWVADNCKEEYRSLTEDEKNEYRTVIDTLRNAKLNDTRKIGQIATRDMNNVNAQIEAIVCQTQLYVIGYITNLLNRWRGPICAITSASCISLFVATTTPPPNHMSPLVDRSLSSSPPSGI